MLKLRPRPLAKALGLLLSRRCARRVALIAEVFSAGTSMLHSSRKKQLQPQLWRLLACHVFLPTVLTTAGRLGWAALRQTRHHADGGKSRQHQFAMHSTEGYQALENTGSSLVSLDVAQLTSKYQQYLIHLHQTLQQRGLLPLPPGMDTDGLELMRFLLDENLEQVQAQMAGDGWCSMQGVHWHAARGPLTYSAAPMQSHLNTTEARGMRNSHPIQQLREMNSTAHRRLGQLAAPASPLAACAALTPAPLQGGVRRIANAMLSLLPADCQSFMHVCPLDGLPNDGQLAVTSPADAANSHHPSAPPLAEPRHSSACGSPAQKVEQTQLTLAPFHPLIGGLSIDQKKLVVSMVLLVVLATWASFCRTAACVLT